MTGTRIQWRLQFGVDSVALQRIVPHVDDHHAFVTGEFLTIFKQYRNQPYSKSLKYEILSETTRILRDAESRFGVGYELIVEHWGAGYYGQMGAGNRMSQYFESHITLRGQPKTARYEEYGYKLSVFNDETPVKRTEYIVTKKAADIREIRSAAHLCIEAMNRNDVGVKRNKLEFIVEDTKFDVLGGSYANG